MERPDNGFHVSLFYEVKLMYIITGNMLRTSEN